jgi:hypothetical protein
MLQRVLKKFSRNPETKYLKSIYICEWWNTISNLPFFVIPLLRFWETNLLISEIQLAYLLMFLAGIFSGIHHALDYPKFTLWLDFFPIFGSGILILHYGWIWFLDSTTWFKLCLAFLSLVVDHTICLIPVPWGHVLWHFLVCFAVDDVYQDVLKYSQSSNMKPNF